MEDFSLADKHVLIDSRQYGKSSGAVNQGKFGKTVEEFVKLLPMLSQWSILRNVLF